MPDERKRPRGGEHPANAPPAKKRATGAKRDEAETPNFFSQAPGSGFFTRQLMIRNLQRLTLNPLKPAFIKAANDQNFQQLLQLINQEANKQAIAHTDECNRNLLHLLLQKPLKENDKRSKMEDLKQVITVLVSAIDINAKDSFQDTPLSLATDNDYDKTILALVDPQKTIDQTHQNQPRFR